MLAELVTIDPGIVEVRDTSNHSLLHYTAMKNSTSCAKFLLKFAPHLFDVVDNEYYSPLQYAKSYYPTSKITTMLEGHLKKQVSQKF